MPSTSGIESQTTADLTERSGHWIKGYFTPSRLSAELGTTEYSAVTAASEEETTSELFEENWGLRLANAELMGRLAHLEVRLAALEAALPTATVVREVTREEAKREIADLFAGGEVLSYSELLDRLQLPLELVVEVCDELVEEGVIAPHGEGKD